MLLDLDELPHVVSIYRSRLVADSGGGINPVYDVLVAAGVPCQIMFGTSTERSEFSQSQFQRNSNTIAFNESSGDYLARGESLTDDRTGDKYRLTGISRKQGIGTIPDYLIVSVTAVE